MNPPFNRRSLPAIPPRWWRLRPFQWLIVDLFDWLFPFCAVNLLWVLCSLTIVLFPPATASLFEVGHRAYQGQVPSARAFIAGIGRWMGPAWMWAAPNALLVALAIIIERSPGISEVASVILAAGVALILLAQVYVWPYMMVQETPELRRALRNSLFTVLADPLLTGVNIGLTVVIGIPGLLVIAPALFVLPVLFALLYTYTLIAWLNHHGVLGGPVREL
ncbi:MAG: DUF624 domain-containing protein [Anaerolineae bacterium]|nr:DUF624 domain-containing protein [Anaerolineae bacterium]